VVVTKKDIAKYLGISRTTVSFVLNNTPNVKVAEGTRKLILRAAQELGYWNEDVSPKLCFILYAREGDDQRYLSHLRMIAESAEHYHYQLVIKSVKANPEDHLNLQKFLLEQKVAGLIISGDVDDLFIDLILETKIPSIFLGGTFRDDLNILMADHKKAAYEATKYLISLNHKKIAFFTGSLDLTFHLLGLEGYKQALSEAGIELDKSLIQVSNEESGQEICKRMEALEIDYTAAYCVNTVIQFSLLQCLLANRVKVPNEVSLIGYGFSDLVKMSTPQLTVVYIDLDVRQNVVSRLMDIIRKKDIGPKMHLLSQHQFLEGGTVSFCRRDIESKND
jgi:LacI family transcriptional regulator